MPDKKSFEEKGTDLTPLLIAPQVLHSAPKGLRAGTKFQILMDKLDGSLAKKEEIKFVGFGLAPGAASGPESGARELVLSYLHEGQQVQVQLPDPDAAASAASSKGGMKKATPGNKLEASRPFERATELLRAPISCRGAHGGPGRDALLCRQGLEM